MSMKDLLGSIPCVEVSNVSIDNLRAWLRRGIKLTIVNQEDGRITENAGCIFVDDGVYFICGMTFINGRFVVLTVNQAIPFGDKELDTIMECLHEYSAILVDKEGILNDAMVYIPNYPACPHKYEVLEDIISDVKDTKTALIFVNPFDEW